MRKNYTSKRSAVTLGTWLQIKAEIDGKFETFGEELDSWFWVLKHSVASFVVTGVSGGYFVSFCRVLDEGEASTLLRNVCNYIYEMVWRHTPQEWNDAWELWFCWMWQWGGFAVFWDVTPCSLLEIYWRFERVCGLHHQDKRYFPGDVGITSLRKSVNLYHTTHCIFQEDVFRHNSNLSLLRNISLLCPVMLALHTQ